LIYDMRFTIYARSETSSARMPEKVVNRKSHIVNSRRVDTFAARP
jgi:hypothetical protein